jgi:serine/threonine protein kinase/tetratricopeptide (TPR) repeat protein
MNDDLPLEAIFFAALEKSTPEERAAYLDGATAGNSDLRRRVEKMLVAQAQAGSFLERPAHTSVVSVDEPITERPGSIIGPYKLLEQIGEGGFGVVFMAEQQQPVRRKVALKVLKPGMDTRQVVARFEAERQALALMDNPNIAHVFDGGATSTGRPYFVMELVRGIPITEFCDQYHVPVRERLELFLNVCQAVQHAHQKGIIHRDLKPSNVLVTLHDDKAVVKVIDFGVAKATGQQLTDKTLFTNFVQMIGTPLYMSPEQAQMSGLDVDTRSDIYSLGVLLYELLTGTTPFNKERIKTAGYDEIRRIIREEEPPKPSTRISTLGQVATTLSTLRKSDPKRLRKLFRGELDWIVMKCLEKDRNRRYETASGLARDIEHYLRDEPVLACPPSAWYRFRKFGRKHRTALRIAGAFVALLVLAAAVSIWQAVRATRERDRAEASFRMARDAVDQLFMQVSQSPKMKTQAMEKFRKDLLLSAKKFYERFISEQFETPGVRYDLGLALYRLGEIHHELGDFIAAEESLTKGVAILGELVNAKPENAEYQRDQAAAYAALGLVYRITADLQKADAAYKQALAIEEKLVASNPEAPEYRFSLAKTYGALGLVHQDADRPESAATMCRQAQDVLSKLIKEHPTESQYKSLLAATQLNLGQLYLPRGSYDEAQTALKQAVGIYGELVESRPDTLPEEREALGRSLTILGMAYRGRNRIENAEKELRHALRIFETLGQKHPDVLEYAYDVGRCRLELARTEDLGGRPEAALEEYGKAIETMEQAAHKGYLRARIMFLTARIDRAGLLAERGDHARATEEVEAVLCQGDIQALHVYDAACAYCRAWAGVDKDTKHSPTERESVKTRYANRAMQLLKQAVAKGWRHPNVIKADPQLHPLQGHEDFQKLLRDLEANKKK